MKKGLLKLASYTVLATLSLGGAQVLANNEAKREAENYIKSVSTFDLFWKGKNPIITGEKYFYSVDEKTPSYIEYKVSCNKQVDCGYVMVNIDNTDVKIPEASSVGKTSSEVMYERSGENSKNYYFSVFEQFSENEKTGEIGFLNPENEKLIENNFSEYRTMSSSNEKNNLKLKEKLEKLKKEARENVQTFVNKKEEKIDFLQKTNYISHSSVSGGTGAVVSTNYISEMGCFSYTPCYNQATKRYENYFEVYKEGENIIKNIVNKFKYGPVGCAPTAFSIIYGYYDRNGRDFVNGFAPGRNSYIINELQIELGRLMETYLEVQDGNVGGATYEDKFIHGVNYKNNIFPKTQFILEYLDFNRVKNEINNGRPLIMNYGKICYDNNGDVKDCNVSGHTIVIHGYEGNSKLFGNFGWGPYSAHKMIDINGKTFNMSYYDYNTKTYLNEEGIFRNFHFIRFN